MLQGMSLDVRYAVRMLQRNRGSSVAAILMLAIGVGAYF